MNNSWDKIFGIFGSLIFHLLIVLILAITVLKANVPEEISFIEVDLGGGSTASQSQNSGYVPPQPVSSPPPQPPSSPQPSKPAIVEQEDESVKIEEAKRRKEANERRQQQLAEQRRKEEAERIRKAEQAAANAISNQVAGSFGKGKGNGSGQGSSNSGSGQSDNPFGNGRGSGSTGDGSSSWQLAGRDLMGEMSHPSFNVPEDGRIVIDITVDPQGKVILAEIGKGTKGIISESLRQSALNTARNYRFSSISGANNQRGTITYNYSLK
ncbi:MAG: TonB family protein [Tannerellaceae bacterium]|jgi:TonB family protein|nr:TonB family protein [Tannerellaceae bacterium]